MFFSCELMQDTQRGFCTVQRSDLSRDSSATFRLTCFSCFLPLISVFFLYSVGSDRKSISQWRYSHQWAMYQAIML